MRSSMMVTSVTLSAILIGPLQAGSVIEDVTATASSWWEGPTNVSDYQHPKGLVNNKGMTSPYDITATHDPNRDAWGQWHAIEWAGDPNPVVTFDLGGVFDLEGIHIWNGNQTNLTGRGVNEFVLSVSTDGSTYTALGTYNLIQSTSGQPNNAQNFDLTGQNGITHVRIRVNSTHDAANNDYANLSEVMFTAVRVPEFFQLSRFEAGEDSVTLAFASEPGQVFDIYRGADLQDGFATPLAAGIPAAASTVPVTSVIDNFDGGLTLGDSTVNFDGALGDDHSKTYVFVPSNGENAGREVAVVSWAGNTITVAEDIESDKTWTGPYEVRTPTPTETEWIDTDPPAGSVFYQVRRR